MGCSSQRAHTGHCRHARHDALDENTLYRIDIRVSRGAHRSFYYQLNYNNPYDGFFNYNNQQNVSQTGNDTSDSFPDIFSLSRMET